MKKLLIATTNPGKLADFKLFLSDLPITLVNLSDLSIHEKPEETGSTFKENAIIKAKFYQKLSGLPTLADDGGLEIDALRGEPGVKSRRWIHSTRDSTDEELIAYALKRVKNIPKDQRGAQFRAVVILAFSSGEIYTAEDKIRGVIAQNPSKYRTPGYPFDSLFFLPEMGKFYINQELTHEELMKFSHRRHASEKLKPIIRKYLLK